MKITKTFIAAAIAFIVGAATVTAQTAGSPYSKYGYGLLDDNATSAQRQMGGIGYAMNSGRQINVKNPASYAYIDSLTFLFDMGVDLTSRTSEQLASETAPASKESKLGGGLDYVTLQVPLGKRMGASVGLVPFSTVSYAFGEEITNGHSSREGSGGLNQLYLGVAGRVVGNFSVGANVSYLFGNVINDVYTRATSSESLFEQVISVRDWHIEVGAQYVQKINADHALGFGLVWSPKKTLLGHVSRVKYDINQDQEPTEGEEVKLKGNAELPETWGAGISYRWKKKLMVEADFTYQPWSKVKSVTLDDAEPFRFADRYRVSVGGEYTHAERGNYLSRITYRAGAFYNRDYEMVDVNNVREYGVSFGFGFPLVSSKTMLNLGLEYRQRQGTPNPIIKENYLSVRLGINFNELWFFQNKIQ